MFDHVSGHFGVILDRTGPRIGASVYPTAGGEVLADLEIGGPQATAADLEGWCADSPDRDQYVAAVNEALASA